MAQKGHLVYPRPLQPGRGLLLDPPDPPPPSVASQVVRAVVLYLCCWIFLQWSAPDPGRPRAPRAQGTSTSPRARPPAASPQPTSPKPVSASFPMGTLEEGLNFISVVEGCQMKGVRFFTLA